MYTLKACVVCFSTDVKLFSMNCGQLRHEFHLICGIKTSHGDGMPDYLCFQCAAVVRNFKRFRDKCHRAHYALKEILSRNKEISQTNLEDLNHNHLGIMPPLSYMTLDKTHYEKVTFQWKKQNRVDWCNSSKRNIAVLHCSTLTSNFTFDGITNPNELEFTEENIKTEIEEMEHEEIPVGDEVAKDEPSDFACGPTEDSEIPDSFLDNDNFDSDQNIDKFPDCSLSLNADNTAVDGTDMDEEWMKKKPHGHPPSEASGGLYQTLSDKNTLFLLPPCVGSPGDTSTFPCTPD